MTDVDGEPGGLAEGTLISHLLELRDRLLKAMIAVGICFIPCAIYMNQLFTFVAEPLKRKLPPGATLIATSVVAPFTVPFKLALVLAIGLAVPCVLYQAWAFVAPGLYRHEKKLAVPLLISSVLLFYLGAAFAYYVVFPVMLSFFVATTPNGVQMMTDMGSYLDFVMWRRYCWSGPASSGWRPCARIADSCFWASSFLRRSSRRRMRFRRAPWRSRCTSSTRLASSWLGSCSRRRSQHEPRKRRNNPKLRRAFRSQSDLGASAATGGTPRPAGLRIPPAPGQYSSPGSGGSLGGSGSFLGGG